MKMLKFGFFLVIFFARVFSETQAPLYPVVIIGGGIGGLTASLNLCRSGIEPLIIEGGEPSQISFSPQVENWPGEEKISGLDLFEKLKNQAVKNGAVILKKEVVEVNFNKIPYEIKVKDVANGNLQTIMAKSCIVATGTAVNRLNVDGEKNYWGRGVSSCALCDGMFYKDKIVAVVGGGNTAIVEALYLSNLAKKVYVIVRKDGFRQHVDKKNEELLHSRPNVEILFQTSVNAILGDENRVKEIMVLDLKTKQIKKLSLSALFLALGSKPNSAIFKDQLKMDQNGFIMLNNGQETSKQGIFAIGDVTATAYKQAIFAASSGALAAIQTWDFLDLAVLGKKDVLVNKIEENNQSDPFKITEIKSLEQLELEMTNMSMPILIDFYATWCAPCKRLAPILDEKAQELQKNVRVFKVDVDEGSKIAEKYKISKMPTLLFFDKNKRITRREGSKEIIDLLNEIIKSKDSLHLLKLDH